MTEHLKHYTPLENASAADSTNNYSLSSACAKAGFASANEEHINEQLNLHHHMVKNAPATFFLKVSGQAMTDIGFYDGDLLVVDRSLEVYNGNIVIACIDNELIVKKFVRNKEKTFLMPVNDDLQEIDITEQEFVLIWGVVTYAIHKYR